MAVPDAVVQLVERFEQQREDYRSGRYNETQLRRDFLDPLFAALGWDMNNERGYAEPYREVIHEDAIKIGGRTKAPDYCFRAGGGVRSFFVEAKKPSVDIREALSPAYQLRRYGWSAKLPVSILTDFEEFAVYDCRIRPVKTDKASTARVIYRKYTEYVECWDELVGLFSPEAIRRGALDKFVASKRVKKGTAEVDSAFLDEIESWRIALARNLALRNEDLSQRDLNFAVQRTIDRMIFLRICEDRGIETYGKLQGLLNGPAVYRRLGEQFQRADERYNSGLFHFNTEKGRNDPPDELTLGLTIDDKALKDIIKRFYFPDSPYEFSVLPAEILGQVYEQFLGKVIRLTKGHQAKIEEKPEVKKAGGVYYTPSYIVDYIVQHTVGKLLDGKTPRQAAKLRVLDPACGSGSFLIGAYQYLLDWHRDRYEADDPEKHARARPARLYRSRTGEWRLTTAEKKRILLNNIYGVDIDSQAVEVTKLSLLLKVLEGESQETLSNQLRLFHERALPDLTNNIKCGNSLIGPDFYDNRQMSLLDEEEIYRINVFDWKAEFPAVFKGKTAGFDAVIGNPPYVRMEAFKAIKDYLRENYLAHEERADLYAYFLERALAVVNTGGRVGMIVSNKFAKAKYGKPLRHVLATKASMETVADFAGANVFVGATVRTMVLIARPASRESTNDVCYIPVPEPDAITAFASGQMKVEDHASKSSYTIPADALSVNTWHLMPPDHTRLLEKLKAGRETLAAFTSARALFGMKTGFNDAFIVDHDTRQALITADAGATTVLRPILFGRDVRRYHVRDAGRFVIYCHPDRDINDYPSIQRHLSKHKSVLAKRAGKQEWFELQQPAVALLPSLRKPKIVYPIIANECRFTLDDRAYCINDKLFILPTDDLALLAVLNSRVANFYFCTVCAALEGGGDRYLEFRAQYVDPFPVPAGLRDPRVRSSLLALAKRLLSLHKDIESTKTAHAKTVRQRQIDATDRQIDRLVYELYDLTDEEIAIVEETTAR